MTPLQSKAAAISGWNAYENWSASSFCGTNGTYLKDVDRDGCADLVAINASSITVLHSLFCMPIIQSATGLGRSGTRAFGDPETWWNAASNGAYGNLMGDVTETAIRTLSASETGTSASSRHSGCRRTARSHSGTRRSTSIPMPLTNPK